MHKKLRLHVEIVYLVSVLYVHLACLIVLAKFQSVKGESHDPALMSNCLTLSHVFTLSIQWMVYYLCVHGYVYKV